MNSDRVRALPSSITNTTTALLRVSNERIQRTDGKQLGILSSHLALTAANDALQTLEVLLKEPKGWSDDQLAAIATRIGDAARAAFAAADAQPEPTAAAVVSPGGMDDQATCSFCGKTSAERPRMVRGPGASICDECVDRARVILG